MRHYSCFISILIFFSCNDAAEKDSGAELKAGDSVVTGLPPHLMKGFELYAWKKDSVVYYTLLPGTNRLKSDEEIFGHETAVKDLSAIKTKLENIAPGEYISLRPIQVDTTELRPLLEFIRSRQLNLSILRY